MTSSTGRGSGAPLFALGLCIVIIQMIGLGYRGLRFAANYEVTTAPITDCERDHKARRGEEWYEFEIRVAGIEHPVLVLDAAKPRKWGWSLFKTPDPEFDWCELKGETVTVYHYDKVRGGVVFRGEPDRELGFFGLVRRLESGAGIIGLVLLPIVSLLLLAIGLVLLGKTAKETLTKFDDPRRSKGGVVHAWAKFANGLILPLISVVLASILTIILGAILIKGMLYVETGSNFLTGLIFSLALLLATISPAYLLKGVYLIRTSTNQLVILARNAFALAALGAVVSQYYQFLVVSDFRKFNEGDLGGFLIKVTAALFG